MSPPPTGLAEAQVTAKLRSSKLLPFGILGASALVVLLLVLVQRTPEEHERASLAPLVRVAVARPAPYRFFVTAHGEVSPRTESDLIPQVSGEIVWMSAALAPGGFFETDDVLARIDPADYQVDLEAARAAVARSRSERDRAKKERERQRQLADRSVASQSRIDDAENAYRVAEASHREALARLERAERDLARTELKAPYRGRIRSEQVDVGQFVTRGAPIARLYAVDYAEIRLPVPDRELAYLDVPLVSKISNDPDATTSGSRVVLSAEFAGQPHRWEGALVRTEGELDPRSRMVNLVARVADPYKLERTPERLDPDEDRTPLAVGLFVEAEIEGESVESAIVLPRDALRAEDRVWVVDAEDRIHSRPVEVLRRERENVIIGEGLREGERICISPLEAAIDGMGVRVLEEEALAERPAMPIESRDAAAIETVQ